MFSREDAGATDGIIYRTNHQFIYQTLMGESEADVVTEQDYIQYSTVPYTALLRNGLQYQVNRTLHLLRNHGCNAVEVLDSHPEVSSLCSKANPN